MGTYTIIADVSQQIIHILRKQLVPDLIRDAAGIGLCSPESREDTSVGIFLYDIQESDEIRQNHMIDVGEHRQTRPPMYLTLYYMITAYAQSDLKFKMMQEERILGKIVQCFYDYPIIEAEGGNVQIQLIKMSTEEKMKLWNFEGKPYVLSLFYKVTPVVLESTVFRDVVRVRSSKVDVSAMRDGGL